MCFSVSLRLRWSNPTWLRCSRSCFNPTLWASQLPPCRLMAPVWWPFACQHRSWQKMMSAMSAMSWALAGIFWPLGLRVDWSRNFYAYDYANHEKVYTFKIYIYIWIITINHVCIWLCAHMFAHISKLRVSSSNDSLLSAALCCNTRIIQKTKPGSFLLWMWNLRSRSCAPRWPGLFTMCFSRCIYTWVPQVLDRTHCVSVRWLVTRRRWSGSCLRHWESPSPLGRAVMQVTCASGESPNGLV